MFLLNVMSQEKRKRTSLFHNILLFYFCFCSLIVSCNKMSFGLSSSESFESFADFLPARQNPGAENVLENAQIYDTNKNTEGKENDLITVNKADDTVHGDKAKKKNKKDKKKRKSKRKKISHPVALGFQIGLTVIESFLLLVLNLFNINPIVELCVNTIVCAITMWYTKNIGGRLIVGMRWWSSVMVAVDKNNKQEKTMNKYNVDECNDNNSSPKNQEEKEEKKVLKPHKCYERDDTRKASVLEKTVFGLCLLIPVIIIICSIVMSALSIIGILKIPAFIVYLIIIISNPCGYLKCSVHKTREKTKKSVEKLKKMTKRKDKNSESSSSSDKKRRKK